MKRRLTPGEIRAALSPEEAAAFDVQYRRATAQASDGDDLTEVLALLKRWRTVAAAGSETAHRRLSDRARRHDTADAQDPKVWQRP